MPAHSPGILFCSIGSSKHRFNFFLGHTSFKMRQDFVSNFLAEAWVGLELRNSLRKWRIRYVSALPKQKHSNRDSHNGDNQQE